MTREETEKLYVKACGARRVKPQQEEGRAWLKTLKHLEIRDAEAALEAWWSSGEKDSRGDLKSRWLPTPAELLALAEKHAMQRKVAALEAQDMLVMRCANRHTFTSFIARKASMPSGRRCRYCSAPLEILERVPA